MRCLFLFIASTLFCALAHEKVTCPDIACILGGTVDGCINTAEIDENGCTRCVCIPQCPEMPCPLCQYGYVIDENGCNTCECIDPCKDAVCPLSESCVPDAQAPQKYRCIASCCPKPVPPRNCFARSHNVCQSCQLDCSLVDCFVGYNCCPDWFGCYTCVKPSC